MRNEERVTQNWKIIRCEAIPHSKFLVLHSSFLGAALFDGTDPLEFSPVFPVPPVVLKLDKIRASRAECRVPTQSLKSFTKTTVFV
jgi:hypothetical protein